METATAVQIEPNETSSRVTTPFRAPRSVSPLAAQLARLMAWARALSLKQSLTDVQADVHMEEWALIAAEVGFPALSAAVRDVMRNDSDWFPSVKAIRERAGLKQEDRMQVETNAAWEWVLLYIRRHWHPDLDAYADAPAIPPRIAYAVRQVGGLRRISMRSYDAEPFMRQDFAEAYRLAPLAAEMRPQLAASFEDGLKRLAASTAMTPGGTPAA